MLDNDTFTPIFPHMNKLPLKTQIHILNMLVEESSIRSTSRISGVSINTVIKLLEDVGAVCSAFHDDMVRGVNAKRVQCDEIWSFCYAKAKNLKTAKSAPEEAGDTWTWTAIEADSKLILSWLAGGRDSQYAIGFTDDVRTRITNRVQLTTDGHKTYLEAVEGAFGGDVDKAILHKVYGPASYVTKGRYSPAEYIGIQKQRVEGDPDENYVSTFYVERQNLTMRMAMRRFTRLTNSFSTKLENHVHALALYFVHYNWMRKHKSLNKCTPAMAAGLTDRLWTWEDVLVLADKAKAEAIQTKRRAFLEAPYSN